MVSNSALSSGGTHFLACSSKPFLASCVTPNRLTILDANTDIVELRLPWWIGPLGEV